MRTQFWLPRGDHWGNEKQRRVNIYKAIRDIICKYWQDSFPKRSKRLVQLNYDIPKEDFALYIFQFLDCTLLFIFCTPWP
jgi:hypothetical protein